MQKKKFWQKQLMIWVIFFRYSPTQIGNNAVLNKLFKGNHTNQKESRDNTKYYTNLWGYTFKVYQKEQLILQVYFLILCLENSMPQFSLLSKVYRTMNSNAVLPSDHAPKWHSIQWVFYSLVWHVDESFFMRKQ